MSSEVDGCSCYGSLRDRNLLNAFRVIIPYIIFSYSNACLCALPAVKLCSNLWTNTFRPPFALNFFRPTFALLLAVGRRATPPKAGDHHRTSNDVALIKNVGTAFCECLCVTAAERRPSRLSPCLPQSIINVKLFCSRLQTFNGGQVSVDACPISVSPATVPFCIAC